MKIKQVEELVGITSKNIRFYEDQGLLNPDRAENGYREYGLKEVETLKKIKLLRKFDISVEDIKLVLSQKKSLEDCLERQIDSLEKQQENLKNVQSLAKAILMEQSSIDTLAIDDWSERVEKLEKEGVSFVNVKIKDIHKKKIAGAIIGGTATIVFAIVMACLFTWARLTEEMPLGMYVPVMLVFIAIAICVLTALISRVKEIKGGEEDEASKY